MALESMQNRVIAGLVTALILSSCLISYNAESHNLPLKSTGSEHSARDAGAEIKIHRPGDSVDSPETLNWAPNNVSEYAIMQFTILIDNGFDVENIDQITIVGSWISNSGQLFEQFRLDLTEFSIVGGITSSSITENYSYPGTVWGGNYSIDVGITFADGEAISFDRSGLQFISKSFYFGYSDLSEENYLCSCEKKILSLTLKNTGEDETEFSYQLSLNDTAEIARVEWTEETEPLTSGTLPAGEAVIVELKVQISNEAAGKFSVINLPIYVEVSFENDEGEQVYLADGQILIEATVLPEEVFPKIVVTFDDFTHSIVFEDGLPSLSPPFANEDYFTYGQDFLKFNVNISNLGYYNRLVSFQATNQAFDYRLISSSGNISIDEYKPDENQISSLGFTHYEILVTNIGDYESETIGFDVNFNDSMTSRFSFDIRPEPIVVGPVFTESQIHNEPLELPVNLSKIIQINLIEYENFLLFNNHWTLHCTSSSEVLISIPAFSTDCVDTEISLSFDSDFDQLANLVLSITISEEYTAENVSIVFSLSPIITGYSTPVLHSYTVDIPVKLADDEVDGDNSGSDGTEENDENNSQNDTETIDNSTGDDNIPDIELDTDGDGVLDNADNCPDTTIGSVVDDSGCEVVEQDSADEPDETTDNIIEPESNNQQESDSVASNRGESNVMQYVTIGLILIVVTIAVLFVRSKRSSKQNLPTSKTIQPVMPLPVMPLPVIEPVVLQQWTDSNGYSWRQMSDQTIMWWNGTDWIPYGKN